MPPAFSDPGYREQVRRLTHLAHDALKAYALDEPQVALLGHVWNTTFRVVAANGDRYFLRVHNRAQASVVAVASELLWLAALRQETDAAVPQPVRNKKGELVSL